MKTTKFIRLFVLLGFVSLLVACNSETANEQTSKPEKQSEVKKLLSSTKPMPIYSIKFIQRGEKEYVDSIVTLNIKKGNITEAFLKIEVGISIDKVNVLHPDTLEIDVIIPQKVDKNTLVWSTFKNGGMLLNVTQKADKMVFANWDIEGSQPFLIDYYGLYKGKIRTEDLVSGFSFSKK